MRLRVRITSISRLMTPTRYVGLHSWQGGRFALEYGTHLCCGGLQLRTQHPLRERAKKLDQGILVIRFEMPFNVFCACGKLIGKVSTNVPMPSFFSAEIISYWVQAHTCCHPLVSVITLCVRCSLSKVSDACLSAVSSTTQHVQVCTRMVCAAQGVRFNAEKQQVGSYISTKIWNFGMKAPCCGERIEVQTDPKNHEYVIVRGARRKVQHCYLTACRVSLQD